MPYHIYDYIDSCTRTLHVDILSLLVSLRGSNYSFSSHRTFEDKIKSHVLCECTNGVQKDYQNDTEGLTLSILIIPNGIRHVNIVDKPCRNSHCNIPIS